MFAKHSLTSSSPIEARSSSIFRTSTSVRNPPPCSIPSTILASVLSMGSKFIHPLIWKLKYFSLCSSVWLYLGHGNGLLQKSIGVSQDFQQSAPKSAHRILQDSSKGTLPSRAYGLRLESFAQTGNPLPRQS